MYTCIQEGALKQPPDEPPKRVHEPKSSKGVIMTKATTTKATATATATATTSIIETLNKFSESLESNEMIKDYFEGFETPQISSILPSVEGSKLFSKEEKERILNLNTNLECLGEVQLQLGFSIKSYKPQTIRVFNSTNKASVDNFKVYKFDKPMLTLAFEGVEYPLYYTLSAKVEGDDKGGNHFSSKLLHPKQDFKSLEFNILESIAKGVIEQYKPTPKAVNTSKVNALKEANANKDLIIEYSTKMPIQNIDLFMTFVGLFDESDKLEFIKNNPLKVEA